MSLDIRVPIGLLFSLIGALLALQGLLVAAPAQRRIIPFNINIAWGSVLILFGVAMLLLARRHARRPNA